MLEENKLAKGSSFSFDIAKWKIIPNFCDLLRKPEFFFVTFCTAYELKRLFSLVDDILDSSTSFYVLLVFFILCLVANSYTMQCIVFSSIELLQKQYQLVCIKTKNFVWAHSYIPKILIWLWLCLQTFYAFEVLFVGKVQIFWEGYTNLKNIFLFLCY